MNQSSFKFHVPVKVRYNDTDAQGHVYFRQYYSFFDEGLEAYLAEIGYDYPAMFADETDLIFAESHCTYKSTAKWPEMLNVHTRIAHVGRRSLRFEFELWAQNDNRLVATGYIAAVTADRQTFKPQPVPEKLRQAVISYEGELTSESG